MRCNPTYRRFGHSVADKHHFRTPVTSSTRESVQEGGALLYPIPCLLPQALLARYCDPDLPTSTTLPPALTRS